MKEFQEQEELPRDLKEWPDGAAKYETFAGESEDAYGEDETAKLGPALTYHDDGGVSIDGEPVENPEDYKGERIELALGDMEQRIDGDRPDESEDAHE
jgi:hypothetical protein